MPGSIQHNLLLKSKTKVHKQPLAVMQALYSFFCVEQMFILVRNHVLSLFYTIHYSAQTTTNIHLQHKLGKKAHVFNIFHISALLKKKKKRTKEEWWLALAYNLLQRRRLLSYIRNG